MNNGAIQTMPIASTISADIGTALFAWLIHMPLYAIDIIITVVVSLVGFV
jgi:hypothetical protein